MAQIQTDSKQSDSWLDLQFSISWGLTEHVAASKICRKKGPKYDVAGYAGYQEQNSWKDMKRQTWSKQQSTKAISDTHYTLIKCVYSRGKLSFDRFAIMCWMNWKNENHINHFRNFKTKVQCPGKAKMALNPQSHRLYPGNRRSLCWWDPSAYLPTTAKTSPQPMPVEMPARAARKATWPRE